MASTDSRMSEPQSPFEKPTLDKDLEKFSFIEASTQFVMKKAAAPGLAAIFLALVAVLSTFFVPNNEITLVIMAATVIAAYMAMNYLLSPEVSTLAALDPVGATDYFRHSHFASPAVRALVPAEYLETYEAVIQLNFPELRMPGGFEYYDTLDVAVQKALTGEATPQQALDEAAAQWEEITDRFGRDEQKAKYWAAMGLSH